MSAWGILVADDEPLVLQIIQDMLQALPAWGSSFPRSFRA